MSPARWPGSLSFPTAAGNVFYDLNAWALLAGIMPVQLLDLCAVLIGLHDPHMIVDALVSPMGARSISRRSS